MKRKQNLIPPLFAAAAALFLGLALFIAYSPSEPKPLVLRTLSQSEPGVPYRLDLNSATASELDSLPGIGPVLAQNILARREENGPFSSPEDLLTVDGIGQKTLDKIEPYITCE